MNLFVVEELSSTASVSYAKHSVKEVERLFRPRAESLPSPPPPPTTAAKAEDSITFADLAIRPRQARLTNRLGLVVRRDGRSVSMAGNK